MSSSDKNFTGSIPEVYDDFLVPLIFETYAQDMAQRVAEIAPSAVLETAAGSGVVTRALAPLLAPDARYVVSDLNPPMLARAEQKQPPDPRLEWQQADAMALPFADQIFDTVCCQFGIMFLPDKPQGFREAWRVLREGGQFIFNVWDHISENEFAQSVTETAAGFFPDDPPQFLPRTPHGYHDTQSIVAALKGAGFTTVSAQTITSQSQAEGPHVPAIAYCQGTPLRNELEQRQSGSLEKITKAATSDIERRFGSGPVSAKIQGQVFSATR